MRKGHWSRNATIPVVVWTTMVITFAQMILPSHQAVLTESGWKSCHDTTCYQSGQTEKFFARLGRNINITKLVREYALICPLYDTCGVELDRSFIYNGPYMKAFEGCPKCTCDWTCQFSKTCCPGCTCGYIQHECIDVVVKINNINPGTKFLPLIDKCMDQMEVNATLTDLCVSGEILPCKTNSSVYKNAYCARCNEGNETCIDLALQTECLMYDYPLPLIHYASLKDCFEQHNCQAAYGDSDIPQCKPDNLKSMELIDSCNITGLWTEYDADIEWGCKNFQTPYGNFKNVFCYICNPSKRNMASKSIAQCSHESKKLGDEVSDQLTKACNQLPNTKRLYPYKNIYCLACKLSELLVINGTYPIYTNVRKERFNHTTLKSDVIVQFDIQSYEVGDALLKLFDQYLFNFTPQPDDKLLQYNILDNIYKENVDEILSEYKGLCGLSEECSSYRHGDIRTNIACEDLHCSCKPSCISEVNCCPHVLLTDQFYSTLECGFTLLNRTNVSNINGTSRRVISCPKTDTFSIGSIIVSKCSSPNTTNYLKYKCESMDYDSDSLKYIPISVSNMGYRNVYCLLCNHVYGLALYTVSLRLQCQTYVESKLTHGLTNWMGLLYENCEGYSYFPQSIEATFSKKHTDYNYQSTYVTPYQNKGFIADGVYRTLTLSYFDRCNITGKWPQANDIIEKVCVDTSPNILVMKPYKISENIYKNFACAICNVPMFDIVSDTMIDDCIWTNADKACIDNGVQPVWSPFKNMHCAWCNDNMFQSVTIEVGPPIVFAPIYKYMFSISRSNFDELFQTVTIPTCEDGFYDVVLGECQIWVCYDEYVLQNGVCRAPIKFGINNKFMSEFVVEYRYADDVPGTDVNFVDLEDLSESVLNEISGRLDVNTDFTLDFFEYRTDDNINCAQKTGKSYKSIDIQKQPKIHIVYEIFITYSPDMLSDTMSLEEMSKTGIFLLKGNSSTLSLFSVDRDTAWEYQKSTVLKVCDRVRLFHKVVKSQTQQSPIKVSYNILDEFLFCPMIRFSFSDVNNDLQTKSVTIKATGWTFRPYMYRLQTNYVYICDRYISKYIQPPKRMHDPLEDPLNTVTLICTIISIVCLLLTFLTYSLFPNLRKRDIGKSSMVLCLVLCLAQASLQFGLEQNSIKLVCTLIGILIHFSLVCSFCTMNVCAFNMFKVFFINRNVRNTSVKFKKYMFYIAFVPSCLVAAVICVNLISSKGMDVGYGKTYCFISDFYQMLCLFFIPSVLIFVANACFFALTFYAIRSSPSMCGKQDRRDFFMYVKLCSIVGLTWPLLMIDNFIGLTWFSFVTSSINALQGVFIFFSFVVNRTVQQLYMDCFKFPNRSTPPPTPSPS